MNSYLIIYLFLLPGSPSVRPFWKHCAKCGLRLPMFWSSPYSSSQVMLTLWGRPMRPVKGWHQVCDFWLFSMIFGHFWWLLPFLVMVTVFGDCYHFWWLLPFSKKITLLATFGKIWYFCNFFAILATYGRFLDYQCSGHCPIHPVQSCLLFGGTQCCFWKDDTRYLFCGYFL